MKRFLFLDVDGVLNHNDWWYSKEAQENPKPFPQSSFDPRCVNRVNEILDKTGAELVISSSWRTDMNLPEIFRSVGLPDKFDITPSDAFSEWKIYESRGEEIDEFLNQHTYDDYVILDDENDFMDFQQPHLFQTCDRIVTDADIACKKLNNGFGLTESLKDRIIKYFNGND